MISRECVLGSGVINYLISIFPFEKLDRGYIDTEDTGWMVEK